MPTPTAPSLLQRLSNALPRAVWLSIGGALLGCFLLELFRPFYFLNDDNLTGSYPVLVEMGRRLWSFQSPFANPYIFDGRNNWLGDPSALSLWNPITLLLSPLSLTPARIALVDLHAVIHLLVSALGFSYLLVYLRNLQDQEISDRRIVFLVLSYTFSAWTLIVGTNWYTFLANQASLPILVLGLLVENRRRGILLIVAGFLYGLLAGHLSPFILTLLVLGIFGVCYSFRARSYEVLRRGVLGGALAAVIASPFLVPAMLGFLSTSRSGNAMFQGGAQTGIPADLFPLSFFFGGLATIFYDFGIAQFRLFSLPPVPSAALAASMASWGVLLSLRSKRRWSALEISCVTAALITVLLVVRPQWLAGIMAHLPLLRSTRYPWREIFLFTFFVHIWIATRPITLTKRDRLVVAGGGVLTYGLTLLLSTPFAFTPVPLDRYLLTTGQLQPYWDAVRPRLQASDKLVPVLAEQIPQKEFPRVPWVLMGAYNYPSLVQVPSMSGYVLPGMAGRELYGKPVRAPVGTLTVEDIPALRARNPHLKFLVLTSVQPVKIELRDGTGTYPLPVPSLPPLTKDLKSVAKQ